MYYALDLMIGFGSAVILFLCLKKRAVDRVLWNLYCLGAAIGLLWEIPIFVLSAGKSNMPLIVWKTQLPAPIGIFIVAHTLWDGLLFLLGVCLIFKINPDTRLDAFKWKELSAFIVWGEISALLVEVSSTLNNGWSYLEYSWNPVLFKIKGQNITALPQIIWFFAPVFFYCIMTRMKVFQKPDILKFPR